MTLPLQDVSPGSLEAAYRRELKNLADGDVVRRLWARDTSLWPVEQHHEAALKKNLAWLDLPERIGPYMARVMERTAAIESHGFDDLVFVAIGGANLAAETIAALSLPKRGNQFFVLDTTDPASIRKIENAIHLSRTLFVFATKSGKSIETHALLLYFLDRLKSAGIAEPGRNFIAVTNEGSYLAQIASQYRFREIFLDPPGISGRFSSLIHFGLLLSTVCSIDPAAILSSAAAMRAACDPSAAQKSNPALTLGALFAAGAIEGWDRLVLLGTKSLIPLTYTIARLVGTSTGKEGHGIIPIFGDVPVIPSAFQNRCMVIVLALHGDPATEATQAALHLQQAGVPFVRIDLGGPEDIGAELFKWEVATTLACALLGVEPFSDPDVRESRDRTAEFLEDITAKRDVEPSTVRVGDDGINLYAESSTRQELSTLNLSGALQNFFQLRHPDGYLAILAFLERSQDVGACLRRISAEIIDRLRLPVLISFGPRYLHYMGQLYQGGPAKGLFLILTGDTPEDIAIPGASYSFGQLQLALALGDFETLVRHHRPVVRLHLTNGPECALTRLERVISQSLAKVRLGSR
jgi:hypothetical protein